MMKREMLLTLNKAPVIEHTIRGFLVDQEYIDSNPDLNSLWGDGSTAPVYTYAVAGYTTKTIKGEDGEEDDERIYVSRLSTSKPETQGYKFVTRSNLQKMFVCDFDGDSITCTYTEEICSGLPELKPYSANWNPEGIYYVRNRHLRTMKSHFFDRDEFSKLFSSLIASNDKAMERLEDAANGTDDGIVGDFKIWNDEGEVYILHLTSGTMIGWYKLYHYGRDNFCNRPEFTMVDLLDFLMLLRHQLMEDPDEPAEDWDNSSVYDPIKKPINVDPKQLAEKLSRNSTYGICIEE
jgi:hypothetical protein